VKKLFLKYGETILSFYVIFGLLGSIILAFNAGQVSFIKTNNILQAFFAIFLISSGAVFVLSFVIYLFIDIREKIKDLTEKRQ
jgi:amino acid permease